MIFAQAEVTTWIGLLAMTITAMAAFGASVFAYLSARDKRRYNQEHALMKAEQADLRKKHLGHRVALRIGPFGRRSGGCGTFRGIVCGVLAPPAALHRGTSPAPPPGAMPTALRGHGNATLRTHRDRKQLWPLTPARMSDRTRRQPVLRLGACLHAHAKPWAWHPAKTPPSGKPCATSSSAAGSPPTLRAGTRRARRPTDVAVSPRHDRKFGARWHDMSGHRCVRLITQKFPIFPQDRRPHWSR
jgi:hypothetical protein